MQLKVDKVELRFIPACAGNAFIAAASAAPLTVHPRVCGERFWPSVRSYTRPGSSPRVRGTHMEIFCTVRIRRFIPACAGNAGDRVPTAISTTVHPRVCGERYTTAVLSCFATGSSPRVRGTRQRSRREPRHVRFIPACAGNALFSGLPGHGKTVHPRVCGERASDAIYVGTSGGSSPRVRGTRKLRDGRSAGMRFIPACAGNASMLTSRRFVPAVHPRVCGERRYSSDFGRRGRGSSPRVRGTRHLTQSMRARNRFIPACAGNAKPRCAASRNPAVHPRVCGERPSHVATTAWFNGSSPRVRGTRARTHGVGGLTRFIPACAGNAYSRPYERR